MRKILGIQRHNEIGAPSFSAAAKGIVSRIRRYVWRSGNNHKFRLFPYEIDYSADELATDAEACQNSLVFKQDFICHEPEKRIPLNPVPEQFGAWILEDIE